MLNENFSQKEILLQLMGKVDAITAKLANQELMLNTIHEASAGRDEKIKDLRADVQELQTEVKELTDKVSALKAFNKTIVAIWSGFILFISMFGKDIVTRLF